MFDPNGVDLVEATPVSTPTTTSWILPDSSSGLTPELAGQRLFEWTPVFPFNLEIGLDCAPPLLLLDVLLYPNSPYPLADSHIWAVSPLFARLYDPGARVFWPLVPFALLVPLVLPCTPLELFRQTFVDFTTFFKLPADYRGTWVRFVSPMAILRLAEASPSLSL